jgi:hypothetical protein
MSPATLYGSMVMTVEAMFGLILLAASAGVVLARFSQPTARVMFSKVAAVTPYNGMPRHGVGGVPVDRVARARRSVTSASLI